MEVLVAHARSHKSVGINKQQGFCVRGWYGLGQSAEPIENLAAMAKVSARQFSNHQWMHEHVFTLQQNPKNRDCLPEMAHPHRGID